MNVRGASVAVRTPGARVSRGPGVTDGGRTPGRSVMSGPIDGIDEAVVEGADVAAGLSATGGCSGAFTFFTCALAYPNDPASVKSVMKTAESFSAHAGMSRPPTG